LRVTVSAAHTDAQVDHLLRALTAVLGSVPVR
jgi:7-keto-8-aminopelargonate synthetase-like enzyme